jgi:Arc/MetJ-type ribon-helix-helix transcriptional regulator
MIEIRLDEQSEAVVGRLVSSGVCRDAGEAVRISLPLLEGQRPEKLEALRRDASAGMEQVRLGEVFEPGSEAETKAIYRERLEQEDGGT